jgi:hypothetical protein
MLFNVFLGVKVNLEEFARRIFFVFFYSFYLSVFLTFLPSFLILSDLFFAFFSLEGLRRTQ